MDIIPKFIIRLAEKVVLGEGACVMLTKNVDVSDELVNGVCGTVTHVVVSDGDRFPKTVRQLDHHQIGHRLRRKQCAHVSSHLVSYLLLQKRIGSLVQVDCVANFPLNWLGLVQYIR